MDVVLLTLRLLLALVFVLAGVTKLLDPAGSRQALVNFGVPARIAPASSRLLPLAELVVAIALIPRPTAWWGALGAFILLALFVTGIATTLARGNTPDCHCFGQLYSEPVGRPTLLRNTALTALAGFVLWQGREDPGASAVAWLGNGSIAERILIVAVVLLTVGMIAEGWFLLQFAKQNGRLLLRLDTLEAHPGGTGHAPAAPPSPARSSHELPIGSVAPSFTLRDITGGTVTLSELLAAGKPVLLVFSDPGCGSCTALLPNIARWQQTSPRLTAAVISRGTPDDHRAKLADLRIHHVLLQHERETAQAYGAQATPSAVMVRSDGTIGSQIAVGPVAIRSLIEPWLEETPHPPLAPADIGTQAHPVIGG